MSNMTNDMRVYKTVIQIQDILNDLSDIDLQYWPESLKKARALINNAEFNLAQIVAKQALHRETGL